jgi:hypothetical protein
MSNDRPRYTQLAFPPYTYVPGRSPHPVSNPAGHMFGHELPKPPPLDPTNWRASETYLYGIDLFNHGFYWEAHETWESLWHAAGRRGVIADFLKGLIKLAAAGVKQSEGNAAGVDRHLKRAVELFAGVLPLSRQWGGIDLLRLSAHCLAAEFPPLRVELSEAPQSR